jgi:hypothetical protein
MASRPGDGLLPPREVSVTLVSPTHAAFATLLHSSTPELVTAWLEASPDCLQAAAALCGRHRPVSLPSRYVESFAFACPDAGFDLAGDVSSTLASVLAASVFGSEVVSPVGDSQLVETIMSLQASRFDDLDASQRLVAVALAQSWSSSSQDLVDTAVTVTALQAC